MRAAGCSSPAEGAVGSELEVLAAEDPTLPDIVSKKREELGASFDPTVRRLLLQVIDVLWVEHLEAMEYLRSSVNLRAYGQRDPLVEYKKEGLKMFQNMEESYKMQVRHMLGNLGIASSAGAGGASYPQGGAHHHGGGRTGPDEGVWPPRQGRHHRWKRDAGDEVQESGSPCLRPDSGKLFNSPTSRTARYEECRHLGGSRLSS